MEHPDHPTRPIAVPEHVLDAVVAERAVVEAYRARGRAIAKYRAGHAYIPAEHVEAFAEGFVYARTHPDE